VKGEENTSFCFLREGWKIVIQEGEKRGKKKKRNRKKRGETPLLPHRREKKRRVQDRGKEINPRSLTESVGKRWEGMRTVL